MKCVDYSMGNWSTIAQGLLKNPWEIYLRKVPTGNRGWGTFVCTPLPQELKSPSTLSLYLRASEHTPRDAIKHSGKRCIHMYALEIGHCQHSRNHLLQRQENPEVRQEDGVVHQ